VEELKPKAAGPAGTSGSPAHILTDMVETDNSRTRAQVEDKLLDFAPAPPAVAAEQDGVVQRRVVERSLPAAGTPDVVAEAAARRDDASVRRRLEEAQLGYPCLSDQAAHVTENLLRLCAAGRPAAEALALAASDARPELRGAVERAAARVAEGSSISDALAGTSDVLPPLLVPALRAWELHGQRDADLRTLAGELRRLGAIEQRAAFPQARWWIERTAERVRLASRAGTTLRSRAYVNSSRGGVANRSRATMRWTDLFAALWRCGVPVSEALEIAGDNCGSGHYRDALYRAARRTRAGVPLSECLAETRQLPLGLIDRLRTGETSGRLDVCLEKFARTMEGDARELGGQHLFMRRILPILFLLLAVVIFIYCLYIAGRPEICAIGALAFVPVAFLVWEFVFKQTVRGEPSLGIGCREPKPDRTAP